MSGHAPAFPDLHEAMLEDVRAAIDRLTFGAGGDEAHADVAAARFVSILAGVDARAGSEPVVAWAQHLARFEGARVVVASVVPREIRYPLDPVGAWAAGPLLVPSPTAGELLAAASASATTRLRDSGVDSEPVLATGAPVAELASVARSHHADLVILGAGAGPSPARTILGSVADGLSHRVTASLLVARTLPAARRVLVATDGGRESSRAVATALRYASRAKAELVVQHVVESEEADAPPEGHLKRVLEAMSLAAPPRVRYVLDVGDPAREIARRAATDRCDLVVVGARGLGRVAALLGSVSRRVVAGTGASVLLVRGS